MRPPFHMAKILFVILLLEDEKNKIVISDADSPVKSPSNDIKNKIGNSKSKQGY